jgi:FkbM family methyltransferase
MNLKLGVRLLIRAAKYRWRLDRPEIRRMLSAIPVGGNVIDVGAHKGSYTYWMARKAGKLGHTIAIEPQADLCRELKDSLAAVNLGNVQVIETALSSREGSSTLHIPLNASRQSATLAPAQPDMPCRDVEVKTTTIDRLVASNQWTRLDFMKIDAEGHELDILTGAMQSITRFKPAILVEAEARKHDNNPSHLDSLMALLAPLGYAAHFNDGTQWRPIKALDVAKHQQFGTGRFCNNIFLAAR